MSNFLEAKDLKNNPIIINVDKIVQITPIGDKQTRVEFDGKENTVKLSIPYHVLAELIGLPNVEPADEGVNVPGKAFVGRGSN